ncbi:hypothetical protein EYF80_021173 [Liparis tanakae]|uniref:Uncharacterized protein n=1 Tax=Liparis tanakae TaxID=230148 RepID=A0A4Z2HS41_9TELE|nr:hypothetical protein EYF80_021173 [Liparis tanakae]
MRAEDPTQPTVARSTGPEPKQRHRDKQWEMRLRARKARRAKTAEQAGGRAGGRHIPPPLPPSQEWRQRG